MNEYFILGKYNMPTINQLVQRGGRANIAKRNKVPAMEACPQKRGVCTRVYTTVSYTHLTLPTKRVV